MYFQISYSRKIHIIIQTLPKRLDMPILKGITEGGLMSNEIPIRRHVLLLFGGESSEHDVSVASARNVFAAIDKDIFDITLCHIDKRGIWRLVEQLQDEHSREGTELLPQLGTGCFTTREGRVVKPDVLLPVLHGRNGEDGTVQGLSELLHVPIVGCDMKSSAICMDKVATKEILSANGIKTVPYKIHREGQADLNYSALSAELGVPLFVKPARAGSSVGVSKVTDGKQFITAMRIAHEHDSVVLIEKAIEGRELEVAALGNPPLHEVSGVGEIVAGDEFYSYDAKYSPESTSQAIIPADLDAPTVEHIRSVAHATFAALGCGGMARVDFFLDASGSLFVNEVNTIPGFTDISMYPKLWQQVGLTNTELITRLISFAVGDTIRAV